MTDNGNQVALQVIYMVVGASLVGHSQKCSDYRASMLVCVSAAFQFYMCTNTNIPAHWSFEEGLKVEIGTKPEGPDLEIGSGHVGCSVCVFKGIILNFSPIIVPQKAELLKGWFIFLFVL